MNMGILIAPSLLSADFGKLQNEIEMVNRSEADWFHVDVMDGVFVPNISFGFPVIKTIKKHATKPLDVHLMIINPDRYLKQFSEAGADVLSVHFEACNHLHRTVYAIKELGMMAGVVINPHTPVDFLKDIIHDTDMILVMAVNPGYGGQRFIHNTFRKVEDLKNLILQRNSKARIEVDGGVDLQNASALYKAGADILVAGNTVFSAVDPVDTIARLKKSIN